jgi:hypothetical protein
MIGDGLGARSRMAAISPYFVPWNRAKQKTWRRRSGSLAIADSLECQLLEPIGGCGPHFFSLLSVQFRGPRRAHPRTTPFVERPISRYAKEVGTGRAFLLPLLTAFPELSERLQRNVLGRVGLLQHPAGERHERLPVRCHEIFQRRLVRGRDPLHEMDIA